MDLSGFRLHPLGLGDHTDDNVRHPGFLRLLGPHGAGHLRVLPHGCLSALHLRGGHQRPAGNAAWGHCSHLRAFLVLPRCAPPANRCHALHLGGNCNRRRCDEWPEDDAAPSLSAASSPDAAAPDRQAEGGSTDSGQSLLLPLLPHDPEDPVRFWHGPCREPLHCLLLVWSGPHTRGHGQLAHRVADARGQLRRGLHYGNALELDPVHSSDQQRCACKLPREDGSRFRDLVGHGGLLLLRQLHNQCSKFLAGGSHGADQAGDQDPSILQRAQPFCGTLQQSPGRLPQARALRDPTEGGGGGALEGDPGVPEASAPRGDLPSLAEHRALPSSLEPFPGVPLHAQGVPCCDARAFCSLLARCFRPGRGLQGDDHGSVWGNGLPCRCQGLFSHARFRGVRRAGPNVVYGGRDPLHAMPFRQVANPWQADS
mmetsp:Transcript_97515/g.232152  ORF Transcript_97515/g.232152 Transcript_97515/m.232152 type:complete len:427 (+) Transcript_97515:609-1889(+)